MDALDGVCDQIMGDSDLNWICWMGYVQIPVRCSVLHVGW